MSAIEPKLVRRTAVISEQMQARNFLFNSLFVSITDWVGADGRIGTIDRVNPARSGAHGQI